MPTPKFKIFCRNADTGESFLAFTWTRGIAQGIELARKDAKLHGIKVCAIWAVPIP